ncbi:MAG: Gfo/Idh/MocA family oxidoreductase [Candidatus Atribacteria bacterium]|nr:Gfo/Idh/MocA family oxidoreductase [Candidatus Atribacteria bacterium]
MSKVLSFGMIGGGIGSLIGEVHRKAAAFDHKAKLVAGCFSLSYDNTLITGKRLGLDSGRIYKNFREMAEKEAARKDKIDFVTIITPNNLHFEIAKAFLEKGINVICDKPLTLKVVEAEELNNLAKKIDLLGCVTYTYSGYPMVKHAREIISKGEIGKIRMVMGEYLQEWLVMPVEKEKGNKQASWRTDPKYSGKSNCVADIGSHIENTVSYTTGLEIDSLCANLDIFVKGRALDDNAEVLVKYTNGARGIYWCSQVAIGYNNNLKIRILGEKGSIEWEQENPDCMKVAHFGQPVQILSRGRDNLYPLALRVSRLPGGHPEGVYEAFANIYSNFSDALLAKKAGNSYQEKVDFPTFEDGVGGVKFINLCVESSQRGACWISAR